MKVRAIYFPDDPIKQEMLELLAEIIELNYIDDEQIKREIIQLINRAINESLMKDMPLYYHPRRF